MFALPAPPFVFGTGIDTNSTLTPTSSHQAHGRLAFQIVKEPYSSRRWTLCTGNQGRTLLRNRNRQVMLGGAGRDRTDDLLLAKQALSQLSYSPAGGCCRRIAVADPRVPILVGLDGFEPSTPALSRRCSNQLSYRPVSGPAGANCRPAVVTTVASQPISVNTGTTGWFRERR